MRSDLRKRTLATLAVWAVLATTDASAQNTTVTFSGEIADTSQIPPGGLPARIKLEFRCSGSPVCEASFAPTESSFPFPGSFQHSFDVPAINFLTQAITIEAKNLSVWDIKQGTENFPNPTVRSFPYCSQGWQYAATCGPAGLDIRVPEQLAQYQCSGGYDWGVVSSDAALEGYVTLADETPVQAWVFLRGRDGLTSTEWLQTDANGYYLIKNPVPEYVVNNWGLPLVCPTSPGPLARGTYDVVASTTVTPVPSFDSLWAEDVDLYSNTLGRQDLILPMGGPDPSIRACPAVGKPVSTATGNVFLDQKDAYVPGVGYPLNFVRSYNSLNSTLPGLFGGGWTTPYETRIAAHSPTLLIHWQPDGTPAYFQDGDTDGRYDPAIPYNTDSWIIAASGAYTRYLRAGGQELFDSAGRLTSLVNPAGQATTLDYQGGLLATITDSGGRELELSYDVGSTQPVSLSGPAGLIATYTYEAGRLKTVTYADGNADGQPDGGFTFTYVSGRLTAIQDRDGKFVESHEYYPDGRAMTSAITGDYEKYTLSYNGRTTTVVDALNNSTSYSWTQVRGQRRIEKIVGPCSSCGSGNDTESWTYDAYGRVLTHTDGADNVTTYTYDPATGDRLTVSRTANPGSHNPIVHTTTNTYYPDGRIHTETAPNGALTTYTYVAAGPETVTRTVTPTVTRQDSFLYTSLGQLWKSTDPRSKIAEYGYTPAGDLDWVKSPMGHTTSFTYDLMGRRTKTILPATTPANNSPVSSYDTLGRVWKVTNPNGSYWQYTFDSGGHRTSIRDPLGRITTATYDNWGRLWKVLDANTPVGETEYSYDLMSRLTSLTDARDKTTSFEYDSHGRTKKVTYPGPRSEHFTYTATGKVETHTDRRGIVTGYEYDGLDRLISRGGTPGTRFGYDANGDLGFMTSAQNAADTLAWNYDLAGQVLSESSTRNASAVSYEYDLAGNRTVLRLNGVEVSTSGYDDNGRLSAITRPGLAPFEFGHDAADRRQTLTYPNGITTSYDHDALSRVTSIGLTHTGTALDSLTYSYDNLGNRTSAQRTDTAVITSNHYAYDALNRLSGVQQSIASPCTELPCDPPPIPLPSEAYTYDAVGNRLTALGVAGAWAYSDRNELQSFAATTLAYDLNGNLLSENGTERVFNWNADNRLDTIYVDGEFAAEFAYDPLGRRVTKLADDGGRSGLNLTSYVYDGEDILRRSDATGTFLYVHGSRSDEPLLQESSTGARTYFHADVLGSIRSRSDRSGAVVASHNYDAFGTTNGTPDGHSYTGREWDGEIDLYYYRARYYDPKVGRFISEDPIGLVAGLNYYSYVGNDPANRVDPYGLKDGPPSNRKGDINGPPAWIDTWSYWEQQGHLGVGWRYAHCMASCETARHSGQETGKFSGDVNEAWQTAKCLTFIGGCDSAGADLDYEDNEHGYTCPPNVRCEDRCKNLKGQNKNPNEFGPYSSRRRGMGGW